jgi:GAF domain-containing protein
MLILLQAMAAKPDAPEPSETASAPTELAELARSLDLTLSAQHVVRTVLEELPRLLPADVTEITLWNASTQSLLPFREGAMSASEWAALNKVGSYRPQEGYSGWLFRHRKPLYIPDVDRQRGPLPKVDRSAFPFRSYIGVPLLFGRECLGTLELASYQPNRYHARDLPLLQTIAALTAAALQRAQEADRLHLRADALDRLAGAVQDLRYANQAGKISLASLAARALDANIAGLLAWDPHKRTLTPIHPFVGLPPRLVDRHLSVFVPEASLRQARWLEQPYWISNRVDEDSEVDTLGLRQFVLNAKVHNLLLASVAPAGRPVAVLLAANKAARETFELEDAHCAMVLGALLAPHLPKDLPPSPLQ